MQEIFGIVIFILAILIALSVVADKIRLPYPILLVLCGLVVGFTPFLPDLALDPDVAIYVFLPPILYDAAFKTSWHDFKKEIRPISTLAVTLVFFTTVAVAVAAHYTIPGFSWPAAFILGAIVSPPDAVAATSITKGLGLNRRVITIIEGESLVNDASALIAYRYAVGALSGTFVLWRAGLEFILVAIGGIAVGVAVGFLLVFAHKKIKEHAVAETSLSLVSPFIAYFLAERVHASGVLSVVTAGLMVAWRSREVFSYETRLQASVVWETLIFLLNGLVFILIGLQLPLITRQLGESELFRLVGYGLIIGVVTIAIRIVWVFAGAYHQSIFRKRKPTFPYEKAEEVSWKNVFIVAWTGTRGVVSLATALGLPIILPGGATFPQRNAILLLTFVVILLTLVVQGLTLPLLIKGLRIKPEENKQQKEEDNLELTLTKKVLIFIEENFPGQFESKVVDKIRKRYRTDLNILQKKDSRSGKEKQETAAQHLYHTQVRMAQLAVLKYERDLLIQYHKDGTFNDEAIAKAVKELDIEEMRLQGLIQKAEEVRSFLMP
ncbi:Na+/H+ antiporter [Segetibacter sp. 3557_3]|uniref:Na+/H+ antiporter n=1 Tax=Segetibacter sp. 3557_3 TaxID=2547429 RepID=UPI001058B707|nr:Na+/H+ antiporter [Segetibacter sp. 3557_3]TDH23035.1 Na+/H+ antiporter [Segetibacter sp. 3557_3]